MLPSFNLLRVSLLISFLLYVIIQGSIPLNAILSNGMAPRQQQQQTLPSNQLKRLLKRFSPWG
jgi:hypothetical protein